MPLQLGEVLLLLLVLHSSMSDYSFPDTQQAGVQQVTHGMQRLNDCTVITEHVVRSHRDFSVVHPEKVDADGHFISHTLSHQFASGRRQRREADDRESERVYYRLTFSGRDLTLNLTVNNNLLSHGYVLERRTESGTETGPEAHTGNPCHLIGTVTDGDAQGSAALSSCNGLTGMLSLPSGVFLIEPVRGHTPTLTHPQQPHVIYRNSEWLSVRSRRSTQRDVHTACGVKDSPEHSKQTEHERERWEREQQGPDRGRSRRSVSTERWVETMVVADSKMLQYHGNNNVESYIFTVMNMVAGMYHDASIGNAIHIVLVRLILLQSEEKGLKVVHHADSTLTSFCSWQKNLNPQSDAHPAHHDVAVLITRKDICAGKNQPCETLGLSHLSGMCQPHRSCNINEDSGLPVAFTIAHELGHSFGIQHDGQGNDVFGIQHDGQGNDCELVGRAPFIMSRQLQYDSSPLTWSTCSKQYITHFLDRGWGFCLDDRPSRRDMMAALVAPGLRYTRQHQCQMQYGPRATLCPETDNVCQILWCSVDGACRSKLDAPIDGTRCGPGKWCISGECVVVGKLPETVNGGWGQWSTWSHCSRTCGSGVQSADRECDEPKPAFGGKYCTGERKRYRMCNTLACVKKKPSFRDMQCSEFDTVPYHNQLYQWIPITRHSHPCELHCRPVDEGFSERMLDAVTDGTPCFSNSSRSICINGYTDMVLIPEGARDIVIQEVEEAANFLAVRAAHSDKYYLNGNYIIQWNGEYQVGGVRFYYERSGNLENLTSPGPTTEPIIVQLLFQETNPGVRYEFIMKKNSSVESDLLEPRYLWKYGAWTDCSATCGQGEQQQPVRCFRAGVGVVDEELCDLTTRPDDRHRHCKNMDCPARWWVGGWQSCSASCGSDGVRKRTVLCVRTVAGEERVLHPGGCRKLPKPKAALACNRNMTCGSAWAGGNWSECSLTCGGGVKSRSIKCITEPQTRCDPMTRPRSTTFCNLQSCSRTRPNPSTPTPAHDPDDLTSAPTPSPYTPTCSTSCGLGAVWRSVVCSSGQDSDCSSTARPEPAQHCNLQPCAVWRKCVEGCVSGMKYKDVQCVDSQSGRVLRPFHCTDQPSPSTVQWKHTRWGQCSQSCGGGVMERSVFCPEPERCDASLRPESSTPCNLQPCVWWSTEPWQQCSKSCGGGVQKRVIRCVSEGSGEEVKSSLCLKDDKPESLRSCGEEECRAER
ncbi:hypothetical protein QTP86_030738, partial [Hemibagrus guttatus]